MMVWSINLFVLAIGIFIVGMIKPQWVVFWMDKPGRLPIIMLSIVLFMCGAVMFGEASLEKQAMKEQKPLKMEQNNISDISMPK